MSVYMMTGLCAYHSAEVTSPPHVGPSPMKTSGAARSQSLVITLDLVAREFGSLIEELVKRSLIVAPRA